MLAVPDTVPERVGWRADLSELQINSGLAQRRAAIEILVNGMTGQQQRSGARFRPKVRERSQGTPGTSNNKNHERYMALAREAAARGDTIEAENLYQHAEHYFRQMREKSV
jgi:hypothetical protein